MAFRQPGVYLGSIKDLERKEHPCFVAYADLPPEQKVKNTLFVTTVRTMTEAFGLI